jgi:phosphatidylinositol glycan class B
MNVKQTRIGALALVVATAAILYFVIAFHAHGFFHADEHYQIIEFSGFKAGTHQPEELPWEFEKKIRPAFQPAICHALFQSLRAIGVEDPYTLTFLLRLLSAALALFAITWFILNTRNLVKSQTERFTYYLLSFFLWFIPLIAVRFSSENWSGLFFLWGLALFYRGRKTRKTALMIGILFGLSFLFRFQIALALAGLGLWIWFVDRSSLWIRMSLGFFAMVLLGTCIDTWFYEELVFTPWNYFNTNLIQESTYSFGTSPWYFYLESMATRTGLGPIPLLIPLILLVFRPKNLLLWCLIPFVAVHSLIPHKEVRFLFPMAYLFPLMAILANGEVIRFIKPVGIRRIFGLLLGAVFVVVNAIGLAAISQKAAGIGRTEITQYIHDRYGNQKVNLIACTWANPYDPWHSIPMKFYFEERVEVKRIDNLCSWDDSLLVEGAMNLLIIRKHNKFEGCNDLLESGFTFEKQSVPAWVERINEMYRGFDNRNILELYQHGRESK